jgi:hypothetical protein
LIINAKSIWPDRELLKSNTSKKAFSSNFRNLLICFVMYIIGVKNLARRRGFWCIDGYIDKYVLSKRNLCIFLSYWYSNMRLIIVWIPRLSISGNLKTIKGKKDDYLLIINAKSIWLDRELLKNNTGKKAFSSTFRNLPICFVMHIIGTKKPRPKARLSVYRWVYR